MAYSNEESECCRQEGIRIRLEYEGEGLKSYLPIDGSITAEITGPGDLTWAVVQLDKPMEYQLQVGQPYQYRLVRAATLFIRARHVGLETGRSMEASVHVLIPLREEVLSKREFDL